MDTKDKVLTSIEARKECKALVDQCIVLAGDMMDGCIKGKSKSSLRFAIEHGAKLVDKLVYASMDHYGMFMDDESAAAQAGGRTSTHASSASIPMGATVMMAWSAMAYRVLEGKVALDLETADMDEIRAAVDDHIDVHACDMGWDALVSVGMASKTVARDGLYTVKRIKNAVHYLRSRLPLLMPIDAHVNDYLEVIVCAIGRIVVRNTAINIHSGDAKSEVFDEPMYTATREDMPNVQCLSIPFFADMFVLIVSMQNMAITLTEAFQFVTENRLRRERKNYFEKQEIMYSTRYKASHDDEDEDDKVARYMAKQRKKARKENAIDYPTPTPDIDQCPLLAEAWSLRDRGSVPTASSVLEWATKYVQEVDMSSFMRRIMKYMENMRVLPGDDVLYTAYNPSDVKSAREIITWRGGIEYYNAIVESSRKEPYEVLRDSDMDTTPLVAVIIMTALTTMYMTITNSKVELTDIAFVMMHDLEDWRDDIASTEIPLLVQYLGGWTVAFDGMAIDPCAFSIAFELWLAALLAREQRGGGGSGVVRVSAMIGKINESLRGNTSMLSDKSAWVASAIRINSTK